MKIGIDARFSDIAGIARYAQNLISNLEIEDNVNDYVIFLLRKNLNWYLPQKNNFKTVEANFPYYSFSEQLLFPFKIWQAKVDLMHFLNFNVPLLYFGRYIITIHDLIYEDHSTFGMTTRSRLYYLLKKIIAKLMIRWSTFRAEKIIVPSLTTKNKLIDRLHISSDKIIVTYEGIDADWINDVKLKEEKDADFLAGYGVRTPYLLYVSTMYPYKNHRLLIDAFRDLPFQDSNNRLQLILVAKEDSFTQRIREYIRSQNLETRVIIPTNKEDNGFLNDQKLQIIFRNAHIYITPSLEEGFGLTILEAWAARVPVLASDIPVLKEIGDGGVEFFNPGDQKHMVEKIKELLINQELRNRLISKGLERLANFSWVRMANQTKEIYKSQSDEPIHRTANKL